MSSVANSDFSNSTSSGTCNRSIAVVRSATSFGPTLTSLLREQEQEKQEEKGRRKGQVGYRRDQA